MVDGQFQGMDTATDTQVNGDFVSNQNAWCDALKELMTFLKSVIGELMERFAPQIFRALNIGILAIGESAVRIVLVFWIFVFLALFFLTLAFLIVLTLTLVFWMLIFLTLPIFALLSGYFHLQGGLLRSR